MRRDESTRSIPRHVVMAHGIGAADRLRTMLLGYPPARTRLYLPAVETAGAALDRMKEGNRSKAPENMVLLLAAEPGRAVCAAGTTNLDAFAAAAADRYASLGEAAFAVLAYDTVGASLRRHGAPDVGFCEDFAFVLAMLGHPARLRSATTIRERGLVPAVVALASRGAKNLTFLPLAHGLPWPTETAAGSAVQELTG